MSLSITFDQTVELDPRFTIHAETERWEPHVDWVNPQFCWIELGPMILFVMPDQARQIANRINEWLDSKMEVPANG